MKPGINIYSGTKGLGAALTNPTCLAKRKGNLQQNYPVYIDGLRYLDAEEAYQALKADSDGKIKTLHSLMIKILFAKLEQYPRLTKCITNNGGVSWLETCFHITKSSKPFRYWEGEGRKSPFIRCLIEAYERVIKECA